MSDGYPDEEPSFSNAQKDDTGLEDSAADALDEGNGG